MYTCMHIKNSVSCVCSISFLPLLVYIYVFHNPVCLPLTFQLAPSHWTKSEWWKWPCAGVGWDSANTKVTRLLCNHQASPHVSGLCVSQYMKQMAGRVLNKHKYMLVIISGYRHLLVPLYTLLLYCPRRVEKENLKSLYLGLHCFKDQKRNYVQHWHCKTCKAHLRLNIRWNTSWHNVSALDKELEFTSLSFPMTNAMRKKK